MASFKSLMPSSFALSLTLTLAVSSVSTTTFAQQLGVPSSPTPTLPKADTKHKVKNYSKVIGWQKGKTPIAPKGFSVTRFADGFRNPRWIYQAPNGDIFISEAETQPNIIKKVGAVVTGAAKSQNLGKSANRITILRDANGDSVPEIRDTFLEKLNQPFGMLVMGDSFYVANTDSVMRYPYKAGEVRMKAKGEKIHDLPAGGYNNHWTRNLIAGEDGKTILISVGSGSNVAENGFENEKRRAAILEISPDGKTETEYASGLRNPVGMDWAPGTKTLWTAVNERDNLGDDLVPDYITSVQRGGFYGWPYSYFGQNVDPRIKEKDRKPELVAKAIVPDVALGSHTASLGLAFSRGDKFPERYRSGAFVAQHGSWNRAALSGYKVVFVPFKDGKPSGPPEDFLTGFIANEKKAEVYGRPVGVTMLQDGSLLVSDDSSNTIWRVAVDLTP